MKTKQEVAEYLRKHLTQAGYDATTDEDIENIIFSEIVVSSDGKPFQSIDPIGKALEYVNGNIPIYIKCQDNSLIRIVKSKQTNKIEAQHIGDTLKAIEPVKKPGVFSNIFDSIAKLFGGRVDACKQWDEYVEKNAEQLEIISLLKKIKGTLPPVKGMTDATKSKDADLPQKPYINQMPLDIQLSGNVNELTEFIEQNNLPANMKQDLINRIKTAQKIEKLAQAPAKPIYPMPDLTKGHVVLSAVDQPEKQSTINGCWSVSLQSLLGYHGVNLTQKEIRDYRPDCSIAPNSSYTLAGQHVERAEIAHRMNADAQNEIADFSDLIHKTIDDVALHHVSIDRGDMKNSFKELVTTALAEHNSPVCMLYNKHYRTIVGIDGDDLLLFNPQNEYAQNKGKIVPDREPISKYTSSNRTVVLDWLEKIDQSRQPEITERLKEYRTANVLSRREGVTLSFTDIKDDGLTITHDIVYPKKYDTLQKVATKETDKSEVVYDIKIEQNIVNNKQAKILTIDERKRLESKYLNKIDRTKMTVSVINEALAHKPQFKFNNKAQKKKSNSNEKGM